MLYFIFLSFPFLAFRRSCQMARRGVAYDRACICSKAGHNVPLVRQYILGLNTTNEINADIPNSYSVLSIQVPNRPYSSKLRKPRITCQKLEKIQQLNKIRLICTSMIYAENMSRSRKASRPVNYPIAVNQPRPSRVFMHTIDIVCFPYTFCRRVRLHRQEVRLITVIYPNSPCLPWLSKRTQKNKHEI